MSKYSIKDLWELFFGNKTEVYDYAGRLMLKSACGDPNSQYHPTIDHIRPLSQGGKDIKENIVICHVKTNEEKADTFSCWWANERNFCAKRKKGNRNGYIIEEVIK